MKFGVMMFPTDQAIDPISLGKAVEERELESLWFPEHSHIPISRQTPWGGREGAPPLPEEYWRSHDAFVALAAVAAVTENIRLATGVTLLSQRDPICTAKEVASLDVLSGGRFIFGVGYGWNVEEMASHGVEYTKRRALLREYVELSRQLWTQDEASYQGEHIQLEPSWVWPKPIQKPYPPIIMGASAGPKTIADMVSYCDGWLPMFLPDAETKLPLIRNALTEAGRDPDQFEITLYGAKADYIEQMKQAGIHRAVRRLPSESAEVVIPMLDEWARVAAAHR